MSILWQDPQREIGGQEGHGSSKMIHPRKASLEKEARTSLKTEGTTQDTGNPRSKMKSAWGSLGLSFCSIFLAPIVGYFVTKRKTQDWYNR